MTDPTPLTALTDETWKRLTEQFLKRVLSSVSIETYDEAIASGMTVQDAVYDAVRNEACNDALESIAAKLNSGRSVRGEVDPITNPPSVIPQVTKMIWVTFQKEGVHLYPAAATDPKLKTGDWDDVSFLGVPHRHIFHFKVHVAVFHDDRDIEFIQLKRWCERLYADNVLDLNHKSCEMISDELHSHLSRRWPGRAIIISVSEDGENGSVAHYPA